MELGDTCAGGSWGGVGGRGGVRGVLGRPGELEMSDRGVRSANEREAMTTADKYFTPVPRDS